MKQQRDIVSLLYRRQLKARAVLRVAERKHEIAQRYWAKLNDRYMTAVFERIQMERESNGNR
jgi:hypothetical protein